MEQVKLRLWTYQNGAEKSAEWIFTPLRNLLSYRMLRQSSESVEGRPRRRPFAEREVRSLKLAAGMLIDDAQWSHFRMMLHAHKIEWEREVGGKKQWIEFGLDIESDVSFDIVEDIDRLRAITVKLVAVNPIWYPDFQSAKVQFTDDL